MKVYGKGAPLDHEVQAIQTEVSSWVPGRGPDWADLQARVVREPFVRLRVYLVSAATLTVIVAAAYFVMATFDLGSLSTQTVVEHTNSATR